MKYDKPLIAVLIGMLAIVPLEVYTQICKNLGLLKLSAFELTSMMMIKEGSLWLGLLTALGTGGLASLLLYRSARFLGNDYLYLKGAGIAMITYALIVILFGTLGGNSNLYMPVIAHYVSAIGAGLTGMLAGFLMQRYLFAGQVKDEKLKLKLLRYLPEPARKREAKVRFAKPRKIVNKPEE